MPVRTVRRPVADDATEALPPGKLNTMVVPILILEKRILRKKLYIEVIHKALTRVWWLLQASDQGISYL